MKRLYAVPRGALYSFFAVLGLLEIFFVLIPVLTPEMAKTIGMRIRECRVV